jgi:hypothetical protein
MATPADIRDLGYFVGELEPGVYLVIGYGLNAELDQAALDALADPATHVERTNERTIDQRLAGQLPVLRDAITAITASPPTLFAGLNNQERVFLRRMARNQADLIRLVLRLLEATD